MDATITEFSSIFAPIKDESVVEKLILDFVGLGFALMASPVWNVGKSKMPSIFYHFTCLLFQSIKKFALLQGKCKPSWNNQGFREPHGVQRYHYYQRLISFVSVISEKQIFWG
jgi:hypothetical protein